MTTSTTVGHEASEHHPTVDREGPVDDLHGRAPYRLVDDLDRFITWLPVVLGRLGTPVGEIHAYDRTTTPLRRILTRPATLGFIGALAIAAGSSLPNSPFTWKTCRGLPTGVVCHPWFFGIPTAPVVNGAPLPPDWTLFIGIVAVYGGMVLLMQAWVVLIREARRHPGIPVRRFVPIFGAWVAPLLVVAPLFSRDAYSYAAQGEMMSRGISPYLFGPGMIGVNSFSGLVDGLWANVTSPYGPVFLWLAGVNATLVHHSELGSVVGFRVLALAGVVMIAVFLPRLARAYGRDGSLAFVLGVLNPLVLLHLVAGAHNDALMLGFLVAGLAVARERRPVLGIVLCTIGAMIKIPGFIGVVYIGWAWLGDAAPRPARLRPLVVACLASLAGMAAVSEMVGLGWGWVRALSNPGNVRSWLDPATALSQWTADLIRLLGLGDHSHPMLTGARDVGMLIAAVIAARLLWTSNGEGAIRAIGLTFLAIVLLGPAVQPWYVAWAIVLLAAVAEGRTRTMLIVVSIVASFLVLPGAVALVKQFGEANPYLLALASVALLALLAAPLLARLRRHLPAPDASEPRTEVVQP
jgi:alpha-1,6-mannosyltransferase